MFKFDPAGNCSTVTCGNIIPPVSIPEKTVYQTADLISVFPNPGASTFTVFPLHSHPEKLITVKIFDPVGRLIKVIPVDGMKESTFSLEDMANGVYSVVAESGMTTQTSKLILIK